MKRTIVVWIDFPKPRNRAALKEAASSRPMQFAKAAYSRACEVFALAATERSAQGVFVICDLSTQRGREFAAKHDPSYRYRQPEHDMWTFHLSMLVCGESLMRSYEHDIMIPADNRVFAVVGGDELPLIGRYLNAEPDPGVMPRFAVFDPRGFGKTDPRLN